MHYNDKGHIALEHYAAFEGLMIGVERKAIYLHKKIHRSDICIYVENQINPYRESTLINDLTVPLHS